MILKPRQIGSTTNEVIKLLDYTIYHRNVVTCIMAHEADAIKKIFRIAKRAYKAMTDSIKPELDRGGGSKYEMVFPKINSLIYCDLESRGDTISRLHISEAAFVEYERYISTMQAVPVDGMITIESTANGIGNWFYDKWMDDDSFEKFFFPWFLDDGYTLPIKGRITYTKEEIDLIKFAKKEHKIDLSPEAIAWRRRKQLELKDFFFQEYPEDPVTCFLLSGGKVINRNLISAMITEASKPIAKNDDTIIFRNKDAKDYYVIGADVSEGVGGDFSHAVCYSVKTREEVAVLRGQFSPLIFARKLVEFANRYTTGNRYPLMAVERNNHGHAVLLELLEYAKYPNLFFYEKDKAGWLSSQVTRSVMMSRLIDSVENNFLRINDLTVLNELMTLVSNRGKVEAASGKHDDAVMATAIALQMLLIDGSKIDLYQNVKDSILV